MPTGIYLSCQQYQQSINRKAPKIYQNYQKFPNNASISPQNMVKIYENQLQGNTVTHRYRYNFQNSPKIT
jgi:hypothetical protein